MLHVLKKFIQAIAVFAAIAGVFFITIGGHSLTHIALSRSWMQVRGQILSVEKVVLDVSLGRPGNASTIKSNVRYRYEFNGMRYEHDRVYFTRPGGETPYYYPASVGKAYHAGDEVAAFVDPSNPSEAVLDRSLSRPILWVCIGFALIAIWVVRMKYPSKFVYYNNVPRKIIVATVK